MIESDSTAARAVRRISVVARTLRPLQREIGSLQDRLAFLTAKKLFDLRKDGTSGIEAELNECCGIVARLRIELAAAVKRLPLKVLADTRIADTGLALDRAERTISSLSHKLSDAHLRAAPLQRADTFRPRAVSMPKPQ